MLISVIPYPWTIWTSNRSCNASAHSSATGIAMSDAEAGGSRSRSVGGDRKMNSGMTPRALVTVASWAMTSSSHVETLNRLTTWAEPPAEQRGDDLHEQAIGVKQRHADVVAIVGGERHRDSAVPRPNW